MNQRIRELINEATSFKEGLIEGKHDIELFDKEKFAELIVGECVSVCENSNYEFGTIFTKMIKEHFGVEE